MRNHQMKYTLMYTKWCKLLQYNSNNGINTNGWWSYENKKKTHKETLLKAFIKKHPLKFSLKKKQA